MDPEDLIQWCYPNESEWQLLSTIYTKHDFLMQPNCKRKCYEMGVKILKPTSGKVKVDQGKISVEVFIDKTHSQNLDSMLDYCLRGKKMLNGLQETSDKSGNHTTRSEVPQSELSTERNNKDVVNSSDENQNSGFPQDLKKYVVMQRADSRVVFDVIFPVPGSYILDIKGKTFSTQGGHNTMSDICQFKFLCNKRMQQEDGMPLPVVPEIGFGPTPHCLRYGVRPVSHGYGHIYILPKEPVKIRFEFNGKYEFQTEVICVFSSRPKDDFSKCTVLQNKLTVEVSIPNEGQYILRVSAKKENDVDFVNIINYMMIFDKKNSNVEVLSFIETNI